MKGPQFFLLLTFPRPRGLERSKEGPFWGESFFNKSKKFSFAIFLLHAPPPKDSNTDWSVICYGYLVASSVDQKYDGIVKQIGC